MYSRSPYPRNEIYRAGGFMRHLISSRGGAAMHAVRRLAGIGIRRHNNNWQRSALNCPDLTTESVSQYNLNLNWWEDDIPHERFQNSYSDLDPNNHPSGSNSQPERDQVKTSVIMNSAYDSKLGDHSCDAKSERKATSTSKVNSDSHGEEEEEGEFSTSENDESSSDQSPFNQKFNDNQERQLQDQSHHDNRPKVRYYNLLQRHENQPDKVKIHPETVSGQPEIQSGNSSSQVFNLEEKNASTEKNKEDVYKLHKTGAMKRSFPCDTDTDTSATNRENNSLHQSTTHGDMSVRGNGKTADISMKDKGCKRRKLTYEALKCDMCEYMLDFDKKKLARNLMRKHFLEQKHHTSSVVMVENYSKDVSVVSSVVSMSDCNSPVTFHVGDACAGDLIPVCPKPKCNYKFIFKSVWVCAKHYQIFHDESVKNYYGLGKVEERVVVKIPRKNVCNICGRKFSYITELKAHWKNCNHYPFQIPEVPVFSKFSCTYCYDHFSDLTDCRTHVIDEHKPREANIDVIVTTIRPQQAPLHLPQISSVSVKEIRKEKNFLISVKSSLFKWKSQRAGNSSKRALSGESADVEQRLEKEINSLKTQIESIKKLEK